MRFPLAPSEANRMNWLRLPLAALAGILVLLPTRADDPPTEKKPLRVLPGLQKDGFVQLPNQWKLNPAGKSVDVGDLPTNIQLHPTGQYAAVIHCGLKEHEVAILDLNAKGRKIVCRVPVDQAFYGLVFSPDGKQVYASGGEIDIIHV